MIVDKETAMKRYNQMRAMDLPCTHPTVAKIQDTAVNFLIGLGVVAIIIVLIDWKFDAVYQLIGG
jgi:hypothetical protein